MTAPSHGAGRRFESAPTHTPTFCCARSHSSLDAHGFQPFARSARPAASLGWQKLNQKPSSPPPGVPRPERYALGRQLARFPSCERRNNAADSSPGRRAQRSEHGFLRFESAPTHFPSTQTVERPPWRVARRLMTVVNESADSNERNERPTGASFALFESAPTHSPTFCCARSHSSLGAHGFQPFARSARPAASLGWQKLSRRSSSSCWMSSEALLLTASQTAKRSGTATKLRFVSRSKAVVTPSGGSSARALCARSATGPDFLM